MTNLQKAVGRNQLLLFWFALVRSVILHLATGGVVVEQKFDQSGYFLMFRGQPAIWVETNMTIYYLKIAQPWVLGAIGIVILASFTGRYFKEIN